MIGDMDIPFTRMVALSFKWVFAALPAILVAYFLVALAFAFLINLTAGVMVLD